MEIKKPLDFWTGPNNLFDVNDISLREKFLESFDNEHDKYFASCFYDDKDTTQLSVREISLYEMMFCPQFEEHFEDYIEEHCEDKSIPFAFDVSEDFLKSVYKKVGPLYNIYVGSDFYLNSCVTLDEATKYLKSFGFKYKIE